MEAVAPRETPSGTDAGSSGVAATMWSTYRRTSAASERSTSTASLYRDIERSCRLPMAARAGASGSSRRAFLRWALEVEGVVETGTGEGTETGAVMNGGGASSSCGSSWLPSISVSLVEPAVSRSSGPCRARGRNSSPETGPRGPRPQHQPENLTTAHY